MSKQNLFQLHFRRRQRAADSIMEERRHLLTTEKNFYVKEAYKSLRTNVMFSLASEEDNKVILVTSSLQNEGKTITATNLAISFAQDDKRVLLVDCDLRRPKLGRLLGLSSKLGLSNILLHPEHISQAMLNTREKNLKVLLAGDIPPNPSELLGSQRMHGFLDAMRQQFDLIILDTPPVNVVTDAMVLCSRVDSVLFVVRAGQSERGAVMRAVDMLKRANARMMGFVLNGVETEGRSYGRYRSHYGYGGYGGYGYGYGYADKAAQRGTEE